VDEDGLLTSFLGRAFDILPNSTDAVLFGFYRRYTARNPLYIQFFFGIDLFIYFELI
jgi:hypothetical protein